MRRRLQTSPRPSVGYPGIEPGGPVRRRVYNPPRIHSGLASREVALRDRWREARQHHSPGGSRQRARGGLYQGRFALPSGIEPEPPGFRPGAHTKYAKAGKRGPRGGEGPARSGAAASSDRAGRLGERPRHCLFCCQRMNIRLHMIERRTHLWRADSDRMQGGARGRTSGRTRPIRAAEGASVWLRAESSMAAVEAGHRRARRAGLENEKRPPGGSPGGLWTADGSQLGPWASQEVLGMIDGIATFTAIQLHARPEPRLRGAAFGSLREGICLGAEHGVLVGTRWFLERLSECDLFFGGLVSLGTNPSRDCFPRRAQSDVETSTRGLIDSQTQNRIIREVLATAKETSFRIAVWLSRGARARSCSTSSEVCRGAVTVRSVTARYRDVALW